MGAEESSSPSPPSLSLSWTKFFFPCFSSFSLLLFRISFLCTTHGRISFRFQTQFSPFPPPSRKDGNSWLYWTMKETGIYCALRARSSSKSDDEGLGVPKTKGGLSGVGILMGWARQYSIASSSA